MYLYKAFIYKIHILCEMNLKAFFFVKYVCIVICTVWTMWTWYNWTLGTWSLTLPAKLFVGSTIN